MSMICICFMKVLFSRSFMQYTCWVVTMLHLPKSARYAAGSRSAGPRLPAAAVAGIVIAACLAIVIYWHLDSEYRALEERYRDLQVITLLTKSPWDYLYDLPYVVYDFIISERSPLSQLSLSLHHSVEVSQVEYDVVVHIQNEIVA